MGKRNTKVDEVCVLREDKQLPKDWNPTEILGLMTLLGFNRSQMAFALNLKNVSTISRMLNGTIRPTRQRLIELDLLDRMAQMLTAQDEAARKTGSA